MQTVSSLLINGINPVTVGGTGTTAKFFPKAPGASIGVASSSVGYVYMPGQNVALNQRLHIMACGNVAPDSSIACPTFRLELVATKNPTAAAPTYTSIVDSTADALGETSGDATATQPWSIEAWIQADAFAGGGVVQGTGLAQVGGDVDVAYTTLSNTLINVDPSAGLPLAFAIRVTFSVSGANNTASMYQFALEQ